MKPGAAVAIAVALFAANAAADDPDAEARRHAQSFMTYGNELVGEGEYIKALEQFKQAYAVYPSPKLLLNQGTTLRLLGRNTEAAAVFEQYLRDPRADPAKIEEVRRVVREIDGIVAHVRVRVSEGGAAVRLDGLPLDAPAASHRVDAGTHEIVAEHAGFAPAIATVRLGPGDDRVVDLTLRRPGERVVRVESSPGAVQRATGYTVGAVGIAAVGVGIGLAIVGVSKVHTAESECMPSDHFDNSWVCGSAGAQEFAAAQSLRVGSYVASIGGAVAIATAFTLVITAPRGSDARATARLAVSPGGLTLLGAF